MTFKTTRRRNEHASLQLPHKPRGKSSPTMGKKSQTKKPNSHNLTSKRPEVNKQLNDLVDKLLRVTVQPPLANIQKELEATKEILTLVEEIQRAEYTKDAQPDRTNPTVLSNFTNWLKANGALFDGMTIASFDGYDLGLKAELDIPEGSLLIGIPRKLMLTQECALKSSLAPLLEKDSILKGMPNVVLAMALLVEKYSAESFWKDYINVLPKEYTTVLYYTYEELKELIGSPTLKQALNQIKSICRQYAYFFKVIYTSDDEVCQLLRGKFTYQQYRSVKILKYLFIAIKI